ncbi:MAG: T9SS type A sorting domain-containing protein [Candidatus Cloacimonadota bacterium]|nr:T9SS type A sorting domain-containing protein [Candidatus Cloacimonadota bacterium]
MKLEIIISLSIIFLFSNFPLIGNTIIVDTTGTGNYTTIQEGINASTDGDTVLVYPGTYYENINFNGKNITVASLYIITESDSFIHQTIIDGNHEGSVVKIVSGEDESTLLYGFTIQNGVGSINLGFQRGGGIVIKDSNPTIKKCFVKNNKAHFGGGLYICNSNNITLSGVTVTNNHATWIGGGIKLSGGSHVNFNNNILSNVYLNYSPIGSDFQKSPSCPPAEIVVDTFTVMAPDNYFISSKDAYGNPLYDVTTSILNSKIEPVNADLYVSPDGDNNNSGLTTDEPLQTISYALTKIASDSLYPNTIHIADGVYSPSVNEEKFPLNLRSYVSLVGESMENTILDGDHLTKLIQAEDEEEEYALKNLTMINGSGYECEMSDYGGVKIRKNNNILLENITLHHCGGSAGSGILTNAINNLLMKNLYIYDNLGGKALKIYNNSQIFHQFSVENCVVRNNLPDSDPDVGDGGGIVVGGDMITSNNFYGIFKNVQVTNNVNVTTDWPLSSVALTVMNNATVDVINATIGDNTTPTGGAVKLDYGAEVNIINSILYGDIPREIVVDGRDMPCTLTVQNSLIQGGMWGIMVLGNNTLNWLEGNIDENPFWIGTGDYPYALSDSSSCIDSGTIDTTGLHLPEYDLAGKPRISGGRIDMGAYEWQYIPAVDDWQNRSTDNILLQNYPNPFSNSTTISFNLNKLLSIPMMFEREIYLDIFNVRGQLIRQLKIQNYKLKINEVVWDGKDEKGRPVPSGIYFYSLKMDKFKVTKRMILIR